MSTIPTLEGIASRMVEMARLRMHMLAPGPEEAVPVLFIHGNGSGSTFWEETMLALPEGFRGLAPDMHGCSDTEPLPVDATLGRGDMVEDVRSLAEALAFEGFHLVGRLQLRACVLRTPSERPPSPFETQQNPPLPGSSTKAAACGQMASGPCCSHAWGSAFAAGDRDAVRAG